jgi:hypothetical protein
MFAVCHVTVAHVLIKAYRTGGSQIWIGWVSDLDRVGLRSGSGGPQIWIGWASDLDRVGLRSGL